MEPKPYEAPELEVLGDVDELTAGSVEGTPDGDGSQAAAPSDRALKDHVQPADPEEVLTRVGQLDVSRWSYRWDGPDVRHIGPMAQDFAAAFEVGADNRKIHAADMNGVALAAIKALKAKVDEQERELAELRVALERSES